MKRTMLKAFIAIGFIALSQAVYAQNLSEQYFIGNWIMHGSNYHVSDNSIDPTATSIECSFQEGNGGILSRQGEDPLRCLWSIEDNVITVMSLEFTATFHISFISSDICIGVIQDNSTSGSDYCVFLMKRK